MSEPRLLHLPFFPFVPTFHSHYNQTLLTLLGNRNHMTSDSSMDINNIYGFTVQTIDGHQKSLSDYKGKVLLIVNSASYCGFTPQYKQLQELYSQYSYRDFHVLIFPCNQFANQEPDDNQTIEKSCRLNYGATFPMFA